MSQPGTEIIDLQALPPETKAHLAERLDVCRRHLWLILIVGVAMAAGSYWWSTTQPPVFEARATLLIEREPKLVPTETPYRPEMSWEYHATQFEIMKSSPVLTETLRRLNVTDDVVSRADSRSPGGIVARIAGLWIGVGDKTESGRPQRTDEPSEAETSRSLRLVHWLRGMITIKPVQGTRLVDIIAQAGDPDFAARIANILAEVYIDRSLVTKQNQSQYAAGWFANRLEDLRGKVHASEHALQAYQSRYGFREAASSPTLVEQRLTELNGDLIKARLKREEAQLRLRQFRAALANAPNGDPTQLAGLVGVLGESRSGRLEKLFDQESDLTRKLNGLLDRLSPLHPTVKQAQTSLTNLRGEIRTEIANTLESNYRAVMVQERVLVEALEKLTEEKANVDRHQAEYYVREREAKSNRQLYDLYLKHMKEADISTEFTPNNVLVSEPAIPIREPIKPRTSTNALLGLLAGLLSGVGLAFFQEYWDRRIKVPKDLQRFFPELTCLGMVPLSSEFRQGDGHGYRAVETAPASQIADSYRGIRTSVLLSAADQQPSSVLITSAGMGEGKTTLAVNLAIALAQLEERRVVLIDADLRKPRIGRIFGLYQKGDEEAKPKGLVDYLVGKAEIEEIQHPTDIHNLHVVPHGRIPPNPTELLHAKRMGLLIDFLRDTGSLVIVDAPPTLPVTDSVVLASQVDGVLLVISARETTREACELAVSRLAGCGGRLLGAILQKVRLKELPSYYAHSYRGYHASLPHREEKC